jgi:hypothetical protein
MPEPCPFCGRATAEGDNFCVGCGAPLRDAGVSQEANPALPVPVRVVEPVPRPAGGVRPAIARAGRLLRQVAASPAARGVAREVARAAVPLAAYVGYRLLERALGASSRPVARMTPPSLEQPAEVIRPRLPASSEPVSARLIIRETVVVMVRHP